MRKEDRGFIGVQANPKWQHKEQNAKSTLHHYPEAKDLKGEMIWQPAKRETKSIQKGTSR
jgi:hypothetical protein